MGVFIEGKIPSAHEFGALCVLTAGVMLAVWEGTVSGSVYGIALCFTGMVCVCWGGGRLGK
jgi:solute carrier family 35, member E4